MTKPRLLLFDLGNVLVRFEPDRFSRTLGLETQDARSHYANGVREMTNKYESGKCSTGEYFSSLRVFLHDEFDICSLEKAFLSVLTDPIPGMEELVRRATAQLPSALVSNTNEYHFSNVLQRIPVLRYLPKRYLSYRLGVIKPLPEFFRHVIRNENVSPNEMLFIDDVLENVEGAKLEGMAGYQFRNATELETVFKDLGVL